MELHTPRLRLREYEESDAPAANIYESDPVVVRYQSHEVRTLDESLKYIRDVLAETAATVPRCLFDLAVTLPDHPSHPDQMIGRIGLRVKDPANREAELWYVLNPAHWGHGYIPEAASAMLQFGFGELGLHRVIVDTDPRNLASIRVAQKLGMRQEAHFIENFRDKGEWCDSLIFALLDREWPSRP